MKGAEIPAGPDLARQREVVDAFFTAARQGDFDALVSILHPDVLFRADTGTQAAAGAQRVHGSAAVARHVITGFRYGLGSPGAGQRPVLVNGAAGVMITMDGQPVVVIGFTIAGDRVAGIDAVADPERLRRITVSGSGDR